MIMKDIELTVKVWSITPKAVLVEAEVGGKTWIPKSVITDYAPPSDDIDYKTTSIFLPEWVAKDKGLI